MLKDKSPGEVRPCIEITLSRDQYNWLLYLLSYAVTKLKNSGDTSLGASRLIHDIQEVAVIKLEEKKDAYEL